MTERADQKALVFGTGMFLRAFLCDFADRAGVPLETLADELQEMVLAVASGERLTCNEINGYREIALFKDGVTT